jgi:Tol biopolymer transport system component
MHLTRPTVRPVRAALVGGVLLAAVLPATGPEAATWSRPGRTTRISVSSTGAQAINPVTGAIGQSSWEMAISADGRFIAYSSAAQNLTLGDTNGFSDIFLHDRVRRTTELISRSATGGPAVGVCVSATGGTFGGSSHPVMTPDARFVAFSSCATNLVSGDTNNSRDGFVYDRLTKKMDRVTVKSNGQQTLTPPGHSNSANAISADGRYVAISSSADDLVPNDTNLDPDAFVFDRVTRKIERVSVSSTEQQADSPVQGQGTFSAGISANGQFVVMGGYASNLVPDDTNQAHDVFVRDRKAGTTERLVPRTTLPELPGGGASGVAAAGGTSISADGRYVMISSSGSNWVPGDTNGDFDIFVFDRLTRRTERISVSSTGGQANDGTSPSSISPDGRYVAVASTANNLVEGDTGLNGSNTIYVGPQPGDLDVFLYDRKFGIMQMLSVAPDGTQARGTCNAAATTAITEESAESFGPVVSLNGGWVAFQSCAKNLVSGDTNNVRDNFVRHHGESLDAGDVRAAASGAAAVVNGYATFTGGRLGEAPDSPTDSTAPAGVLGSDLIRATMSYRPERGDLWLTMDVESFPGLGLSLSGIAAPGDPRVLYATRFVANGVSYEVRAGRLGVNPSDPTDAAFGLFQCTEQVCTLVSSLTGGYGTTGERVVVSIPLSVLSPGGKPLAEGAVLTSMRSFTALGSFASGAQTLLDQVNLTSAPSVTIPGRSVTVSAGSSSVRAKLNNGSFSATLPLSAVRNAGSVRVKVCLGKECRTTTHAVNP